MNLAEMKGSWTEIGRQVRAANDELAAMAMTASREEIAAKTEEIQTLKARMDAAKSAYDMAVQAEGGNVKMSQENRDLNTMLKSNEYARAFAYALQHGLNRRNARNDEQCKILFDALTEGGNSGADGGFLVPIDINNQINEQRRALDPLAELFGQETVETPTGWRVTDTAPTKGLVAVNEMASVDDDDDQPVFAKVTYTCSKYGLVLPISNELMADNVANLFGYVARWFAKKLVVTENGLILTALKTLVATSINSAPITGLRTALNTGLDPAISTAANIILNQTAFDVIDGALDNNDRPMLTPDVTQPTVMRFMGRPIKLMSNAQMPNVTGSPSTSDIFIGDGHQFGTLFTCGGFELASTDIGGSAWRTDSTEVRGIVRLGFSKFDAAAMVRRNVQVPA